MYSFIFRAINRLVSCFCAFGSQQAAPPRPACRSESQCALERKQGDAGRNTSCVVFISLFILISLGVWRDLAKFEPLTCRQTCCSPPLHHALLQLMLILHLFPRPVIPQWFAVIKENSAKEYICCLFGKLQGRPLIYFECCFILERYRLLYAINWGNFDNCSVVGFIYNKISIKEQKWTTQQQLHLCNIWLDKLKICAASWTFTCFFIILDFMRGARFCFVDVKRKTARLSLKPNDLLYEAN